MAYPPVEPMKNLVKELELYSQLQHEYGAVGLSAIMREVEAAMKQGLRQIKKLPASETVKKQEPNSLAAIRKLRPKGPRRLWESFDRDRYLDKLEGALMARCAGCILGSSVEFYDLDRMERMAEEQGLDYPLTDYWMQTDDPLQLRYDTYPRGKYTRNNMDGVAVDDDIVYTMLGLLVVEDHGIDFSVEDNGMAWVKYLPHACTAERVALANLRAGIPAKSAGVKENPYCEWIGADIRSDPWAYMAPGYPEFAADMAHRDAYLSHRRNGIFGEMYFSAAIAAAFAVDHPVDALEIGLTEIPKQCQTAKAIRWALKVAPQIKDYRQANEAALEKFKDMSHVHTIINAVLTVWGLTIGELDVTRVIGETVAMGLDNDCTAATAGSIVGAIVGRKGVPKQWTRNFNNKIHTYINGHETMKIDSVLKRFAKQAQRVHAEK